MTNAGRLDPDRLDWATNKRLPEPADAIRDCYRTLIAAAEGSTANREGLTDTPARAARAWAELTAGYNIDPASLFTTFEADGYDQLVMVTPIPFYSLCEHHLLPFHGRAHVGYLPHDRIVGLSKLARLVDCFSRRLQVQERLTEQIADAIDTHLNPLGTIVVIEAEHLCMAMRGARTPGASTKTSALRGAMLDNPAARAEAFSLIG
jgi:GTP cyclohydrolase I